MVQAIRRRWRLAAGIFLIACVGVGVFVFARVRQRPPVKYRSTATVQVAQPAPQGEKKSNSNKATTTTTIPDLLLSAPQKLALKKTTVGSALAAARQPAKAPIGFNAKNNREKGTLALVTTAQTARDATTVSRQWSRVFLIAHDEQTKQQIEKRKVSLQRRVQVLHDELRTVDMKLSKLMPIVYGGILRYDAANGNNPPPGRASIGRTGGGPPPVPEQSSSTYALNLAYERIQLQGKISDLATNLAQLRIQDVQRDTFRLVSQTPALRISSTRPTTLPALAGLLLGLLVALGAALLADRADRSIRDPAAAAAAFAAPVLSIIPLDGDGEFAVLARPSSATADAYRGLAATSIATDRLPRAIMVSTPHGDAHERVAANYAAALSRLGLKVALVATSPDQSWYMKPFNVPRGGAATLPELLQLAHDGTLNGHLQDRLASTDKAPNLVVVPPSDRPMLQMPVDGLPPLLHALADSGIDVTVISGPPLLEDAEATIVAWATRSVLWAIEPGEVTQVQARAAAARLELAGVTPFGVVMVQRRANGL